MPVYTSLFSPFTFLKHNLRLRFTARDMRRHLRGGTSPHGSFSHLRDRACAKAPGAGNAEELASFQPAAGGGGSAHAQPGGGGNFLRGGGGQCACAGRWGTVRMCGAVEVNAHVRGVGNSAHVQFGGGKCSCAVRWGSVRMCRAEAVSAHVPGGGGGV